MKKTYEKPQILIESYSLSQHIASCDIPIIGTEHAMYRDSCYVFDEEWGEVMFSEQTAGCEGNDPTTGCLEPPEPCNYFYS